MFVESTAVQMGNRRQFSFIYGNGMVIVNLEQDFP
jgi:hypothetical protein